MTQYTRSIMYEEKLKKMSQKEQDLLRDELNYLENLPEHTITDELIDDVLGPMRIIGVPMFIETLKHYLSKGKASLTRGNIKQYPHLHIVEDTKGNLIAYVYNRGAGGKKERKFKSATDVFYDHFDPQVP